MGFAECEYREEDHDTLDNRYNPENPAPIEILSLKPPTIGPATVPSNSMKL